MIKHWLLHVSTKDRFYVRVTWYTWGSASSLSWATWFMGFIGIDDGTRFWMGRMILDYRTELCWYGCSFWFCSAGSFGAILKWIETNWLDAKKEILQLGTFVGEAIAGAKKFRATTVATVDVAKPQMWVTSGRRLRGEVCCFCNYILEGRNSIGSQAQPVPFYWIFHGHSREEMVAEDYQVQLDYERWF